MIKKYLGVLFVLTILLQSCTLKKDVLYFQDARNTADKEITYLQSKIQVNDILSITVKSLLPDVARPYNVDFGPQGLNNVESVKLQGYLVSTEGTIMFPVLGELKVSDKTTLQLESFLTSLLEKGGHLKEATVNVRILNAKVTVLGEVARPGTYNFTEQNITLLQALGYAGDLTINGQRKEVMVIREENNTKKIVHIDMTQTDWFTGPYYYVKQNDVIVVNPNNPKIKSAGFIGNIGTVLTLASLILTSVVLFTRK
jgi:polysaccharide biosynthesis/export protein